MVHGGIRILTDRHNIDHIGYENCFDYNHFICIMHVGVGTAEEDLSCSR